jgi:hypothetical protein
MIKSSNAACRFGDILDEPLAVPLVIFSKFNKFQKAQEVWVWIGLNSSLMIEGTVLKITGQVPIQALYTHVYRCAQRGSFFFLFFFRQPFKGACHIFLRPQ